MEVLTQMEGLTRKSGKDLCVPISECYVSHQEAHIEVRRVHGHAYVLAPLGADELAAADDNVGDALGLVERFWYHG